MTPPTIVRWDIAALRTVAETLDADGRTESAVLVRAIADRIEQAADKVVSVPKLRQWFMDRDWSIYMGNSERSIDDPYVDLAGLIVDPSEVESDRLPSGGERDRTP